MTASERPRQWISYWLGIAFIVFCLSVAFTCCASADDKDPCWLEKQTARSVCRALGRKSPECVKAVDDYKLCRAVASDDPIGGVE